MKQNYIAIIGPNQTVGGLKSPLITATAAPAGASDLAEQTKTLIGALNLISRNLPLLPELPAVVSHIYVCAAADDDAPAAAADEKSVAAPEEGGGSASDDDSVRKGVSSQWAPRACSSPLSPRNLDAHFLSLFSSSLLLPSTPTHFTLSSWPPSILLSRLRRSLRSNYVDPSPHSRLRPVIRPQEDRRHHDPLAELDFKEVMMKMDQGGIKHAAEIIPLLCEGFNPFVERDLDFKEVKTKMDQGGIKHDAEPIPLLFEVKAKTINKIHDDIEKKMGPRRNTVANMRNDPNGGALGSGFSPTNLNIKGSGTGGMMFGMPGFAR